MRLDFERSFGRGLGVLVLTHFLMAFLAIYLFESLVPRLHEPLEKRLQLRRELENLAGSLNLASTLSSEEFAQHWTAQLQKTNEAMRTSSLAYPSLSALHELAPTDIQKRPEQRDAAQHILLEIARAFDKDSGSGLRNYRLSLLGGGWSVALLSILSLFCFAWFHANSRRHVLQPLREMYLVMNEWKQGNRLRRCQSASNSPDVRRLLDRVNEVMDEVDFRRAE